MSCHGSCLSVVVDPDGLRAAIRASAAATLGCQRRWCTAADRLSLLLAAAAAAAAAAMVVVVVEVVLVVVVVVVVVVVGSR